MKKCLVTCLFFLALGATVAIAGTSPWCFDCHCLSFDPSVCICTVETTSGEDGFENCWVQTVLGEDDCILSGWCRIGSI